VILAGGTRYQSLGLPNEVRLRGRGVIDCTPCDGGFFVGKPVAVYGSNEYAVQDAAYLANLGAKVTLLAPDHDIQPIPGVEVRTGVELSGIVGEEGVDAILCTDTATRVQQTLPARGVAIRIGSVPNTDGLTDVVDCDADGYVVTDADLATSADFVLACGDIRSGAPGGVTAAVQEGTLAAARAGRLCAD
jgi:thioredoxin reductase (NADPH)